jgi:hypothetical protein
MDPMEFFFLDQFIFPDEGGVTGTRRVACPRCGCVCELKVDAGNTNDAHQCGACQGGFAVDWQKGTIRRIE